MEVLDVLRSSIDRSINVILNHGEGGKVEVRAVQRTDTTLILYLSSSAGGCSQACRMCWLVQTGQTKEHHLTVHEYLEQATVILDLLNKEDRLKDIKTIHWNFMAQGDAMANPHFINGFVDLYVRLLYLSEIFIPDVKVQYKISTIFPTNSPLFSGTRFVREWLFEEVLDLDTSIEFYYSLYSLKPDFRKKWLPKAASPEVIGKLFRDNERGLRLHHGLIKGLNDTEEDIALIHEWLEKYNLHVDMNLIHYNPFGDKCGQPSDAQTMETYVNQMSLSHRIETIQIISKVGPDVAASCGMFISA